MVLAHLQSSAMSEIFAAHITAVANVVLAVLAIVTADLAGLAYRKQSRAAAAGLPGPPSRCRWVCCWPARTRPDGRLATGAAAPLRKLLGDPLAAADAVAALRRYSLVIPAGDGLVQVHRLVQAVTRAQLTAEDTAQ